MLGRFRSALYSAMGTPEAGDTGSPNVTDLRSRIDSVNGSSSKKVKYAYQRPIFLQLFSEDEIQVTADHMVRKTKVFQNERCLKNGKYEALKLCCFCTDYWKLLLTTWNC